jgi:preprotein translocase subunit SecB
MQEKYKFIDSRIISMNFQENIFSKKNDQIKLSVEVETSVMVSANNDGKYLIQFTVDINDENDNFKLKVEIINRVELSVEKDKDLNTILEKVCLPDLLRRARKMIKDVTTNMNIKPLDLPPFSDEIE